jgi:hypothetical protein|tara:strand:- start:88 stop:459 length:372 start_codon:yes stop_codon:yes gene_type:complete
VLFYYTIPKNIDTLTKGESMSDESKTPLRKDRRRAKKKTHKLTERHVNMIRSQKGKQSVREIAKWFARETHYIYKVSPSMVHHILTGKRHARKEDQRSIYDLIEEEVTEEELAQLDPKKVNYD